MAISLRRSLGFDRVAAVALAILLLAGPVGAMAEDGSASGMGGGAVSQMPNPSGFGMPNGSDSGMSGAPGFGMPSPAVPVMPNTSGADMPSLPGPNMPYGAGPVMPSAPEAVAPAAPQQEVGGPTGEQIVLAVPNNVFANLKHGKLRGIIAEAIDAVLRQMNFRVEYIGMPSGDMRNAVHAGSVDVGTSMLETRSVSKNAFYTNPVVLEYNVLLVRRGEAFPLSRVSDLYGRRIGARVGFKYPLIEDDDQVNLLRSEKDGENVRKLILGDLDAVIIGGVSDLYELRAEGVMSELEVLEKAVGFVPLGGALSNKRFSRADLNRFNRGLADLRNSDQWTEILGRNGFLDLVKEWPLITE